MHQPEGCLQCQFEKLSGGPHLDENGEHLVAAPTPRRTSYPIGGRARESR